MENPVINSPFAEPLRHFGFDDDGITNEIVPSRQIARLMPKCPVLLKRLIPRTRVQIMAIIKQ